jgi:rubrerythrin
VSIISCLDLLVYTITDSQFHYRKWEKLYGEEAKHVKASAEAEKAREERKLARQLKKSASGGNKTELGKKRPNASNESKSVKSKPVDEHLHPSWEAKKVQQDLMAKALSGSGGLGNKKIVFDDSD